MIHVPARPISSGVILSRVRYERAKDLNVSTADFFAVEHDHVRAQHCGAPACPAVNFNHALFLPLNSAL